mmetsp:Transcript_28350/g.66556  ORF Transcript_28350/g.66556 Transcript_28350/m.66556 type:complete len:202 (+) Transcript_28350:368-973(+)
MSGRNGGRVVVVVPRRPFLIVVLIGAAVWLACLFCFLFVCLFVRPAGFPSCGPGADDDSLRRGVSSAGADAIPCACARSWSGRRGRFSGRSLFSWRFRARTDRVRQTAERTARVPGPEPAAVSSPGGTTRGRTRHRGWLRPRWSVLPYWPWAWPLLWPWGPAWKPAWESRLAVAPRASSCCCCSCCCCWPPLHPQRLWMGW